MTETLERPPIITLPQSVADRIAAGEVVERPAAVVKELIENAIDGGADRMTIAIEDAGRTLIKVVDNGFGMTESDLAAAIGRHSTSKLKRFEDLESLSSFGFRGEALPSIAAVSRLNIISRARGQDVGTELSVSGGKIEKAEPVAAPEGTSISVGHLFFNVPARRKFLRTDATEFKWIASVFKHFALAFPSISWELYRNKDLLYQLNPGDERSRLAGLFGDDVAEEMIPINFQRGWLTVHGLISPGSLAQRTTSDQYLYINNRPIVSPRLNRAIYTACEPYYTSGGHPIYVIKLESAPDQFDINVHPAKKEVKFADEKGVFGNLWAAVRRAISDDRAPRELTVEKKSQMETAASAVSERSPVDAPAHLTPFVPLPRRSQTSGAPAMPFSPDRKRGEEAETDSQLQDLAGAESAQRLVGVPESSGDDGPVIWQVFDTYLVSPLKTGIVFIDQHVAHERILYERALRAIEKEPWTSQVLLFPVSFAVSPEDVDIVEECLPLLRSMGFAVDPIGPRDFRIQAVPAGIRITGERDLLLGIIAEFKDTATSNSDPRHRLAAAFACRGAVKAGQPLKTEQMQRLIDELFGCEDPEFCPHGRPIYHVINRREIDKWFRR